MINQFNNWYTIVEKNPFTEIHVNGFENLSEEFQQTWLAFSIGDSKGEEFRRITMCDVDPNDKEILDMIYKELEANGFQRI